ncbi:MAG: Nramp family divalent metal transporter [Planctomycetota bacterium]
MPASPVDAMDPYQLTHDAIQEPPTTLAGKLRHIGPGFILSASIVGSGELIATTIVGAKAGFILMWFIIFSCLVKVAVQLEFGKHAIGSGESTMASFNTLPGPKLGSANWTIWTWLLLMLAKMLQVGGIVGGVVMALAHFFPSLTADGKLTLAGIAAAYVVAASVALLVFQGYYQLLEKASLIMIGAFTLFTMASLFALQATDYAISSSDLVAGIVPTIPDATLLVVAMGAFGITGVGGDEIMAYNYWLIEKGYARYVGPKDESAEWERRAKGWIRIMYWDALLSMVAYTLMTVMFYLLGAAVLNRMGQEPADTELISALSTMYTETLGPWARTAFVVGAIVVLYSTLMAALAAWSRMFADAFGRVGLYDFQDEKSRRIAIAVSAWLIPFGWATLFAFIQMPDQMVILGGISTVFILLIVIFASLYFRYKRLDPRLVSGGLYDFCLWTSSIAICLVAFYLLYVKVFLKVLALFVGEPEA